MHPRMPLQWTRDELENDRLIAENTFRETRMQEPLQAYLDAFEDYRSSIENLLELTTDLSKLVSLAVDVSSDRDLLEAVRYLSGPPISADDLKIIAEVSSLAPSRLKNEPELARR